MNAFQVTNNSEATTIDLKIFGIAELAVTIIAVSIPILRVFIRNGHRSYVSKQSSSQHSKQLSISQQSPSVYSRNIESREGYPSKELPKIPVTVEVTHGPGSGWHYQV